MEDKSFSCLMSNGYEDSLEVPTSFWNPSTRQEQQPDKQFQGSSPVSVSFISKSNIPQSNQTMNSEICKYWWDAPGNPQQMVATPEEDPDDQDLKEESTYAAEKKKGGKRIDDSNNGHKKMITFINKCLSSADKKTIKNILSSLKLKKDSKKGSRYGLILSLMNVKYILGQDKLIQLYQLFREGIDRFIAGFKSNEKAHSYLAQIKGKYLLCFQQILRGDLQSSVKMIYEISERFKEKKYESKGLSAVIEYRHSLEELTFAP